MLNSGHFRLVCVRRVQCVLYEYRRRRDGTWPREALAYGHGSESEPRHGGVPRRGINAVSLRADAEILCRPEGPIALLVRTRQERARAERTAIDKAGDEYEAMLRNYGDGDDFTGSSVRTEPHEPPPRAHDACSPRRERRVRARRPRSEMAAACRLTRAAARCACSSSRIRDTRRRLLNAGRQRSCAFGQPA